MDNRTPWQAKHEIDGLDEEGQARNVEEQEQAYREVIRRLYVTCKSTAVLEDLLNRLRRSDGSAVFMEPLLEQQRNALHAQTPCERDLFSQEQQVLQQTAESVLQELMARLRESNRRAAFMEPLLQQHLKARNPETDEEWAMFSLEQQELQEAADYLCTCCGNPES